MNILQAMDDPRIFGRFFHDASWDAWKAFLAALFALPPTPEQRAIYERHTGRTVWPTAPARLAFVCTGRRAGKSIVAALISVYMSACCDWQQFLGPGERATAMTVSPDRRQSRVIGRFQRGFFREIPALAQLVSSEGREWLELSNRVTLETMTADEKTLRGYVSHVIVNDEFCYLPTDNSADPDTEIMVAEKPCLASLPGSLLLSISSPRGRHGCMWSAFESHYAKNHDPVLFWKASSLEMNPLLDPAIIAQAYEEDPAIADAEWGGNFRSDCERLISPEMLERCIDLDRPLILPPNFEDEEESYL